MFLCLALIFSPGAGGMSLGAVLSGIPVRVAIEKDLAAGLTYSANHPGTKLLNIDISLLSDGDIVNLRNGDDPIILFGGPPCQGFSYSNPRHRRKGNASNWLFKEFLRFVTLLEPEWVVYENVRGIQDTAGGYFLNRVMLELEQANYALSSGLINAADFGVPQKRKRFFVVAHPLDVKYRMCSTATSEKSITVDEAIRDLPILSNGHSRSEMSYGDIPPSEFGCGMRNGASHCFNNLVTRNNSIVLARYPHIPPGGNWRAIPAQLLENYADPARCHTGIYHRLLADEPSVVIGNYRKNMLVHPTQDRGLSVREAARLQSFPDSYIFYGSIGYQQQQVGNAVPPLLSKAIFDSIQSVVAEK